MKIEMANSAEINVDCPVCVRIIRLDSSALNGVTSVSCPYCGNKTELPKQDDNDSCRQSEKGKSEIFRSEYTVGEARKRNRLVSVVFLLMKLAVVFVLLCVLGGGKFNGTYFMGVKRTPGFEQSYINLEPVSAFGMARMEQKLRDSYSYIVVKYNKKSGLKFFERL